MKIKKVLEHRIYFDICSFMTSLGESSLLLTLLSSEGTSFSTIMEILYRGDVLYETFYSINKRLQ